MQIVLIALTFFVLSCRATVNVIEQKEEFKYNCRAFVANEHSNSSTWKKCNCVVVSGFVKAKCEDGITYFNSIVVFKKE